MSNYATKSDFKNATDVYTSDFAKNTDLASFKSAVDNVQKMCKVDDKLDVDKLVPVPIDLKN